MNKRHRASGARGQEGKAMGFKLLRGALNFINFGTKILQCHIFPLESSSIPCEFFVKSFVQFLDFIFFWRMIIIKFKTFLLVSEAITHLVPRQAPELKLIHQHFAPTDFECFHKLLHISLYL